MALIDAGAYVNVADNVSTYNTTSHTIQYPLCFLVIEHLTAKCLYKEVLVSEVTNVITIIGYTCGYMYMYDVHVHVR